MANTTNTNTNTSKTVKTTLTITPAEMGANLETVRPSLPLAAQTVKIDGGKISVKIGTTEHAIELADLLDNPPRLYRWRALNPDACKVADGHEDARDVVLKDARAVAFRASVDGAISRAANRLASASRSKNPDPDADADDLRRIIDAVGSVICYPSMPELYTYRPELTAHEARLVPVYAVWYADAAAANVAELAKIAAEGDFNLEKLVETLRTVSVSQKDKVRAVQGVYGYFASAWKNGDDCLSPLKFSANASDVAALSEAFGRKYKRKDGRPELCEPSSKILVAQFYLHMVRVFFDAKVDEKRLAKAAEQPATVEEPAA